MRIDRCTLVIALLTIACLPACSTQPRTAEVLAQESGYQRTIAPGERFEHVVYESGIGNLPITTLHVYIEGDGTPWERGRYPAKDPTPRRALAMELMMLDSSPAIYLGRPCYSGLANSEGCQPAMWTARRYAPEVVDSMVSVINDYQSRLEADKLVLVGYSGGGALATLLAGELTGDRHIITIAANLDTQLWIEEHNYLPLTGSINPANHAEGLADIPQQHLIGGADEVVSKRVTMSYARHLPPDAVKLYPDFDHRCCWLEVWPSILSDLKR